MNRTIFSALILSLALVLGWMVVAWDPTPEHGSGIAPAPTGGDFTLMSPDGPVALGDFRGKVVLLYFGYTWCPDVCPTNLGFIALGLDRLTPAERDRVQVLFVSVDPQRDTPERLREYTAFFHRKALGLTGTEPELARVAALYGAAYRKVENERSAAGYLMDHSALTFVVDPRGLLRHTLEHGTPPERIAAIVSALLKDGH